MNPLQLKAQMQPATRRADGSVTLKLVTAEEIGTDSFAAIDAYRQQFGWFLFRPNQWAEGEMPKQDADLEGKTPSQRLRAVLFVLHQQRGGQSQDFPAFYANSMTSIIETIKAKLE